MTMLTIVLEASTVASPSSAQALAVNRSAEDSSHEIARMKLPKLQIDESCYPSRTRCRRCCRALKGPACTEAIASTGLAFGSGLDSHLEFSPLEEPDKVLQESVSMSDTMVSSPLRPALSELCPELCRLASSRYTRGRA